MTDQQYIEAIKVNDQEAFSELYHEYHDYFFNSLKNIIEGLPFDAKRDYIEDLYSETIVALMEKVQSGKFEVNISLRNYLVGIGKFKYLSNNRKKKVTRRYEQEVTFTSDITEEMVDSERDEIVDKLVETMGEPCASLLRMFYWERLSGKEIVEKTNGQYKNADSVKSQKSKCMSKIKERALEFVKMELL